LTACGRAVLIIGFGKELKRLETFSEPQDLVENDRYLRDRNATLEALDLSMIDQPIVDIVGCIATLPHCFTLQSCYGHFLCAPNQDLRSLNCMPREHVGTVRYRIAYLAFCIENSGPGRALLESLEAISRIDPDYVQLGSAEWFWKRWVNSYALQVEPLRYRTKDEIILQSAEAFHVQEIRDLFFKKLRDLFTQELSGQRAD
jgi:hypothetical protein